MLGGGHDLDSDFSVASVVTQARRETGLQDYAEESHLAGLSILAESMQRDARLTEYGRGLARGSLVARISNRLAIQREIARHPRIIEIPIERPVFITGLPRSGTTFLHWLLAQVPGFRAVKQWEAVSPAPSPTPESDRLDPRPGVTEASLRSMDRDVPVFHQWHPIGTFAPAECGWLLRNSFSDWLCVTSWRVSTYARWLLEQDMRLHYEYYRRQLQVLCARMPRARLILKDPFHLASLPALLRVFPDARIIFTLRDPMEVTASFCSLMAVLRGRSSRAVDPVELGREWLATLSEISRRATAARQGMDPHGLYDLPYADLTREPLAAVRGAFSHFGEPLSPAQESALATWLQRPTIRAGEHPYHLAAFGLSPDAVSRAFEGALSSN